MTRLYNSKAAKPPATWATMYGSISAAGKDPFATIITVTAGLKCPPENGPKIIIDTINAIPIGIAEPVAKITYKKSIVPKNSANNLFIIIIE